jgi:hypothetical protein
MSERVGRVCPQCGRTYPGAARFCKVDGAILRPCETRPRRRWLRGLVAVLALLAGLIVAGRLLLPRYLARSIDVSVEQVRLTSSGASTSRPASDPFSEIVGGIIDAVRAAVLGGAVEVQMRVTNRAVVSCRLLSAHYTLLVGDQVVVDDAWAAPGGSLAFDRGRSVRLKVVMRPRPGVLSATVIEALRRGQVRVRATGQVRVELPVGCFNVPFRVERIRLDLSRFGTTG